MTTARELEDERIPPPRLVGVEWWVRQEQALFEERWGAFMREYEARRRGEQ